ncbi:MAG: DUF2249 domain-containing protein [Nocardioidaceae bacterium]
MSDVLIASSHADSLAVDAVVQHHAELTGALTARTRTLLAAAGRRDASGVHHATVDLVGWLERELVPHALAEEHALYPAARALTEGRLLVEGLLQEHRELVELAGEVAAASDALGAAAGARALLALFESHVTKENDQVLPLLAASPEVDLAGLLALMHDTLGRGEGQSHDGGHHTCGCGEDDAAEHPVLDAREIPHSIRHATIFGALESVAPGGGLVLVAPHDPLPLLDQAAQRFPGRFDTDNLERGPEAWRILFTWRR